MADDLLEEDEEDDADTPSFRDVTAAGAELASSSAKAPASSSVPTQPASTGVPDPLPSSSTARGSASAPTAKRRAEEATCNSGHTDAMKRAREEQYQARSPTLQKILGQQVTEQRSATPSRHAERTGTSGGRARAEQVMPSTKNIGQIIQSCNEAKISFAGMHSIEIPTDLSGYQPSEFEPALLMGLHSMGFGSVQELYGTCEDSDEGDLDKLVKLLAKAAARRIVSVGSNGESDEEEREVLLQGMTLRLTSAANRIKKSFSKNGPAAQGSGQSEQQVHLSVYETESAKLRAKAALTGSIQLTQAQELLRVFTEKHSSQWTSSMQQFLPTGTYVKRVFDACATRRLQKGPGRVEWQRRAQTATDFDSVSTFDELRRVLFCWSSTLKIINQMSVDYNLVSEVDEKIEIIGGGAMGPQPTFRTMSSSISSPQHCQFLPKLLKQFQIVAGMLARSKSVGGRMEPHAPGAGGRAVGPWGAAGVASGADPENADSHRQRSRQQHQQP